MSKRVISEICGVETDGAHEYEDDNVEDKVEDEDEDEDEDKDDDEDEGEEGEEGEDKHEHEFEGFQDEDCDDVDISGLDPSDGMLFPNICDEYDDAIRWLIKIQSRIESIDCPRRLPVKIIGSDHSIGKAAIYDKYATGKTPLDTKVGQQLNVANLLLTSCCRRLLRVGDSPYSFLHPDTLRGKYVCVVCVFAPARWVEFNCQLLGQLRDVSQHLSQALNFEMLIVPKMRPNFDASKAAFLNFLSAFHGCLFVPFDCKLARERICYRLNFRGIVKAILVDTRHNIAQNLVTDIVANYYYPPPNTEAKLQYLSPGWIRPPLPLRESIQAYRSSSLAYLLDSSYGDPNLCLHSLSSTETITVGQLSNNLVGVYVFKVGDKLKSLEKVYNQCRKKGLDFHVVVACISYLTLDPVVYHRVALREVRKLIPPHTPWWVLPYNTATYANLYKLCRTVGEDAMITVGPSRKFFADVHGGEVLHRYGIQAYPFNREMIVRKYELGAKAVTLDSLLSHGDVDYVLRGGERVPVADLYDKVVVIYIYFEVPSDAYEYKLLSKWYKEIRKQHSDFEVVFVYYKKPKDKEIGKQHISEGFDLLVRPFDPEHSKFIRKHGSFFRGHNGFGFPYEGLGPGVTLLFGKGGRLCALDGARHFENYGVEGYPYTSGCGDDYLRDEIMLSLACGFRDFMCGYGGEERYDVVSLD